MEIPTWKMVSASCLGISPFSVWLVTKLGVVFIPYFVLHLALAPLAIRLQDGSANLRWGHGVAAMLLLHGLKTSVFIESQDALVSKMMLYVSSTLWECSNAALVVGGRSLLAKCGIDSSVHALVVVLSPAQIKFRRQGPISMQRGLLCSAHLTGFFLVGRGVREGCRQGLKTIETSRILEIEVTVLLISCFALVFNLPSHFWQLCMIKFPVQVIYPYGAVYFSSCLHDFWSRWSRPASQLLHYALYYPIGGRDRAWHSVPLLFFVNCISHCGVSKALLGYRSEAGWNIVFGVLCLPTWLETLCDGYMQASLVYRVVRGFIAHVACRIAAYMFVHKVLHLELSSLIGTNLKSVQSVISEDSMIDHR